MIPDVFIKVPDDVVYDLYKDEISPESLTFVSNPGSEKLITQDTPFYFVPMNGKKGDILKFGDDSFFWEPLNKVKHHDGISNVTPGPTVYLIQIGTDDDTKEGEFLFTSNLSEGQEMTVYFTKNKKYRNNMTVVFSSDKYISVNGLDRVYPEEDKWKKVHIFSDGTNVYVDIDESETLQESIDGKMDNPENNGVEGQVLTKTASGHEWKDPETPLRGNYIQSITQNGGYVTFKSTNFRTGNSDDKDINFKTVNGQSLFGIGDIKVEYQGPTFPDGGESGQVLTKTENGMKWENMSNLLNGTTLHIGANVEIKTMTKDEYKGLEEAGELDPNAIYLVSSKN